MSAWRRPPGYLAFVVLGLALVVGATLATAFATADDPGNKAPLYVGVGSVAIFMVLLLAYQWVGIALAAREPEPAPAPAAAGDPPADLLTALALDPTDRAAPSIARRRLTMGAVRHQAVLSAMVLAVAFGGIAYVVLGVDAVWQPFGEEGMGFPLAFAPVFAVLAFALLSLPFTMREAVATGDALYRPLGLQFAALPQLVILPGVGDSTHLVGDTVIAGVRHGRRVEVVLSTREHAIAIEGPFEPFTVRGGRDGALTGTGAAAARVAAITPGRRWRGVQVDAGPGGLTARRKGGGAEARERWLDDLWLAEECAAA